MARACVFCAIVRGETAAHTVHEDDHCLAFLDHRPLFPGHVLLIPREHAATLPDLGPDLACRLTAVLARLCRAVPAAVGAEGTFVAMNNTVSQSVPHAHWHVVPRRKGDGLKGFFWPRRAYSGEGEMRAAAERIRRALA